MHKHNRNNNDSNKFNNNDTSNINNNRHTISNTAHDHSSQQ